MSSVTKTVITSGGNVLSERGSDILESIVLEGLNAVGLMPRTEKGMRNLSRSPVCN